MKSIIVIGSCRSFYCENGAIALNRKTLTFDIRHDRFPSTIKYRVSLNSRKWKSASFYCLSRALLPVRFLTRDWENRALLHRNGAYYQRESIRDSNTRFTTGCFVTVAFIDDISCIDLSALVVKPVAGTTKRSHLPHWSCRHADPPSRTFVIEVSQPN